MVARSGNAHYPRSIRAWVVIPVEAGIHLLPIRVDWLPRLKMDNMGPRFRGDDEVWCGDDEVWCGDDEVWCGDNEV